MPVLVKTNEWFCPWMDRNRVYPHWTLRWREGYGCWSPSDSLCEYRPFSFSSLDEPCPHITFTIHIHIDLLITGQCEYGTLPPNIYWTLLSRYNPNESFFYILGKADKPSNLTSRHTKASLNGWFWSGTESKGLVVSLVKAHEKGTDPRSPNLNGVKRTAILMALDTLRNNLVSSHLNQRTWAVLKPARSFHMIWSLEVWHLHLVSLLLPSNELELEDAYLVTYSRWFLVCPWNLPTHTKDVRMCGHTSSAPWSSRKSSCVWLDECIT